MLVLAPNHYFMKVLLFFTGFISVFFGTLIIIMITAIFQLVGSIHRFVNFKSSTDKWTEFGGLVILLYILAGVILSILYYINTSSKAKKRNIFIIGTSVGFGILALLRITAFVISTYFPTEYEESQSVEEMTTEEYADFESRFDTVEEEVLSEEVEDSIISPYNDIDFGGLIIPLSNSFYDNTLHGTIVYDGPQGSKIGRLNFDQLATDKITGGYSGPNAYRIHIYKNADAPDSTKQQWSIEYLRIEEGYIELKKGCWIRKDELEFIDYEPLTKMNYLIKNSERVLGYYPNDPGLNLYEMHDKSSKVIVKMEGDLYDISLTNEINGRWCKVKVDLYNEHPCSGPDESFIIKTFTGWIELIDVNRKPNVYNYERGC